MAILRSGLLILLLYLTIILSILAISQMQPVQAVGASVQPTIIQREEFQFPNLADAAPHRDITKQRFAPLDPNQ